MDNHFVSKVLSHRRTALSTADTEVVGGSAKHLLPSMGASALTSFGMTFAYFGVFTNSWVATIAGGAVLLVAFCVAIAAIRKLVYSNEPWRGVLTAFNIGGLIVSAISYWSFAPMALECSSMLLIFFAALLTGLGSAMFFIGGVMASPLGLACDLVRNQRGRVKTLGCRRHDMPSGS